MQRVDTVVVHWRVGGGDNGEGGRRWDGRRWGGGRQQWRRWREVTMEGMGEGKWLQGYLLLASPINDGLNYLQLSGLRSLLPTQWEEVFLHNWAKCRKYASYI